MREGLLQKGIKSIIIQRQRRKHIPNRGARLPHTGNRERVREKCERGSGGRNIGDLTTANHPPS